MTGAVDGWEELPVMQIWWVKPSYQLHEKDMERYVCSKCTAARLSTRFHMPIARWCTLGCTALECNSIQAHSCTLVHTTPNANCAQVHTGLALLSNSI